MKHSRPVKCVALWVLVMLLAACGGQSTQGSSGRSTYNSEFLKNQARQATTVPTQIAADVPYLTCPITWQPISSGVTTAAFGPTTTQIKEEQVFVAVNQPLYDQASSTITTNIFIRVSGVGDSGYFTWNNPQEGEVLFEEYKRPGCDARTVGKRMADMLLAIVRQQCPVQHCSVYVLVHVFGVGNQRIDAWLDMRP